MDIGSGSSQLEHSWTALGWAAGTSAQAYRCEDWCAIRRRAEPVV